MRAAFVLMLASALATLFGFVPTGVVAVAHAARGWSLAAQGRESGAARAGAAGWLTATVVIGVLVEAPVVAAML